MRADLRQPELFRAELDPTVINDRIVPHLGKVIPDLAFILAISVFDLKHIS